MSTHAISIQHDFQGRILRDWLWLQRGAAARNGLADCGDALSAEAAVRTSPFSILCRNLHVDLA